MKKFISLAIMALTLNASAFAQDDDLYFVSSKQKQEKQVEEPRRATYTPIQEKQDETNWAEGRGNGEWDVDTYNRRDTKADTANAELSLDEENDYGIYTTRIVRFHSPRVGVYVSSPYYVDVYDYWYDPWFYNTWYDPWYTPWYGWGWHAGYWPGWYGWGWHYPHYHYGWGWNWGWHHPHYDYAWGWGHRAPSNARYGRNGGWISYSGRPAESGNRYTGRPVSGNRYGYRPSRDFGNNYNNSTRPSRNFGNDRNNSNISRPSRNFGNSNTSRPARSFGNDNNASRPSRSNFSAPSRNVGGGSVGGGRSGGGRSFGGRR